LPDSSLNLIIFHSDYWFSHKDLTWSRLEGLAWVSSRESRGFEFFRAINQSFFLFLNKLINAEQFSNILRVDFSKFWDMMDTFIWRWVQCILHYQKVPRFLCFWVSNEGIWICFLKEEAYKWAGDFCQERGIFISERAEVINLFFKLLKLQAKTGDSTYLTNWASYFRVSASTSVSILKIREKRLQSKKNIIG
jgi:hypothetical protein